MPNPEAQTVARALVGMRISRFGCPVNFHSDEGTNFTSELIRQFCRIIGIEKISIALSHLEWNASIKKSLRILEGCLSKYVEDHQLEWKSYSQLVLIARSDKKLAFPRGARNVIETGN